MKILVWMNCYGAWDPENRAAVETIGYNQYLDEFVKAVASLRARVGEIYISGGMLDKNGKTECETVKPELEKRFRNYGFDLKINTDEESLTSITIMKQFLKTWKENYSHMEPIIFIDDNRLEVNRFTFEEVCRQEKINLKVDDVVISLRRLDNHPDSQKNAQDKKLEIMKEIGIDEVERIGLEARKEHRK